MYYFFSTNLKKLDNNYSITYKLVFINSFKFMSNKLSDLADNLSEIYKKECKECKERKINRSVWNFIRLKNNKLNYEFKKCKKRLLMSINGLIKKFQNIYQFCNGDINKFVLLLKKGVYPYEYIDSWKRFDEASLPNKKAFYNELFLEDITDKDYIHAQKVFKELKLKNIGDYHDLQVQCDTLLLADVFENFRNKCIEIN